MNNIKPLLNEASYDDVALVLNSCSFNNWNNMKLIESLSHSYNFHDEEKTKENLLRILTEFWNSKCIRNKNSVKAVTKATNLATKTFDVINSRPVQMIINNNIAKQRHQIQKQRRAFVRDDILDQGYKDAETSLANDTNSVDRTEVPEEHESPKQKKRKALHKKEFKTLNRAGQLKKLTEFYGTEGVLDLSRKASIPKKFASDIEALKKVYSLNLPYLLKREEHCLLKKIAQCRNKEDLYATVKDIDPFTKGSALPYIKQAVQKLCYLYKDNLLEDRGHNEDWFRIMVYGDLFDYIFASAEGYITKRSECHSRIIKSLKQLRLIEKDVPNVKLDFIFCNTSIAGINVVLICEDKPTENESTKDSEKTRKLRKKAVVYWGSILHFSNALEHLSSTSCRFNKLNLLITTTKIIDSTIIHTTLKEVSIPVSERSGGAIADFISLAKYKNLGVAT
ncbi:hypothetical protein [Parasitella parasitica]|uniref:Uncharacterized protein n=1 Tax=Parasitella parasitica TaxID=35722 RepID=A0A0B7NVN8_9FUNG|nr:hypothetical protein [Parasitella parasitica]